jgi:hypothetical protein
MTFRGNGRTASVVGNNKCDPSDHALLALIFIGCCIFLAIGVCIVKSENRQKDTLDYNYVKGDF